MKKVIFSVLLWVCFATTYAQQKPNIIFILVDDLGYGDVGIFFQNQRKLSGNKALPFELSPQLDKMAANGAILTQQYANAPVCAPSRASLLTGVNQGNANVRDNQFDKALENNHTTATVLKQAGYRTTAIGKWGLQGDDEKQKPNWPAHPLKRGFDDYFGYMRHADGHEHYPVEGVYRGKKEIWANYNEVSTDYAKCYTTDLWTAKAKDWITKFEGSKNKSDPFFMYLAYDAPHAVLELPTQGYPKGGGVNGGLKWLGQSGHMINTASGEVDSYIHPDYANATYDDDHNPVTPEIPWPDTYKRYATAVRRIDEAVGDLLKLLKDLKINDNTLIVFSSDNGPSIESYLPKNYVPNLPTFFSSYGPFDGIKRDCWEGGMRMPVIAQWSKHIRRGSVVTTPSMLSDWLATFADAAKIAAPAKTDGVSLLPSLLKNGNQKESLVYSEYFEGGNTPKFDAFEKDRQGRKRGQMQMIRFGDLVGVRYNIKSATDNFEIYDVIKDPKQTDNLVEKNGYVDVQLIMKNKVLQVRTNLADAKRPYDSIAIPAVVPSSLTKPGLKWRFVEGSFPWVIAADDLNATQTGYSNSLQVNEVKKDGCFVFTAYLKVPKTGKYVFTLTGNQKAFVRLHSAAILDADFNYTGKETEREVVLEQGFHPVKIYTLNKDFKNDLQIKFGVAGNQLPIEQFLWQFN
ncbi:sulfatase-like hydrolase/transferase [Pedobacter nototheniae]|uniref:sulfatase-like hydrolase/transferase n=1 Tax=Pedobacter nototheniae TaxID=2488994 RepID=UPI00293104E6|nr:sulfatase-like hydrolase/transferase [Pedobacter nototheniae]